MDIDEILNQIIEICKRNQVSSLYLFGSYAKGTNTQRSDIDIVVDGEYNYFQLEEELQNISTLRKIDIFERKKCEKNQLLMEDILKYGKRLY